MIFQERFGESTLGAGSRIQASGERAPRATFDTARVTPSAAMKLARLLSCDPLDLGCISDEIRAHPKLEVLVMRMATSLALSPNGSILSIEEAAVALGKNRLRVLVHMWSSLQGDNAKILDRRDTHHLSGGANAPEALYIASFMRLLGTDSPPKPSECKFERCLNPLVQTEDFAELTDIFGQDFISLIPFLGPTFKKETALANAAGMCREEVE